MSLKGGGSSRHVKRWILSLTNSSSPSRSYYGVATLCSCDRVLTRWHIWRECYNELQGNSSNVCVERVIQNIKLLSGMSVIEPPEVKVKLAKDIWEQMHLKRVNFDPGMYNTLFRVYISNDHPFTPSQYLEKMREHDISPNMGTLYLFLEEYCNQGNITAATKVLEQMKSLNRFKSEPVFAAFVTGHARAGDMKEAENIINLIWSSRHVPHNMIYTSLLCAYAERGNIESVEKTFSEMCRKNIFPVMKTYKCVMNTLSKYGHGALIYRVLNLVKNKEWVLSDLRSLTYNCLVRDEVEASSILIKELAENDGLHQLVLILYINTCIAQGKSISQVMANLKDYVNLKTIQRAVH